MAPRRTRSSLRAPSTPDSTLTPLESVKGLSTSSTNGTTTALGSEVDEDGEVKVRGRRAYGARVAKRNRSTPSDDEDEEDIRAVKRRATKRHVFVEVPQPKRKIAPVPKGKAKTPVKGKGSSLKNMSLPTEDSDSDLLDFIDDDDEEEGDSDSVFVISSDSTANEEDSESEAEVYTPRQARKSPRKARGSEVESEGDLDMLSLAEELDDDEEGDEIMLEAAIKESLASAFRGDSNGAGPSTSRGVRNSAAAKRAAAAEKRLATERNEAAAELDEIFDGELSEEEEVDEAEESDDEEPAPKKKKGGQPAKSGPRSMTIRELKRQRRLERQQKREELAPLKAAEARYRKTLGGRKLTYAEKSSVALWHHHPELETCWGDLEKKIAIVQPVKADQPEQLKVKLLPFQQESLYWMRKQEKGVWKGGMLADEMGMGKTIQMLALLSSDRVAPNLVVAPTVAIMQWKNEIEAHTTGFKVALFHGTSREKDAKELKKFDVVLTTYAVLEASFRKQQKGFSRKGQIVKEKSPLHTVHWNRIILDEAHNIKERATNTAKGAFELKGEYRWCLSGTPLQNRVGELYSLVRFLGGDPFSYYYCKRCDCKSLHWSFKDKRHCDECGHTPMMTCFWNNEILTPIQKHAMIGPGQLAFKKLKILLDRMMLRRTKVERADDLGLPPRTVIVRRDYFSPEEKELYLSLFSDAKRQFSTYVHAGTLLNNYSNIFSLITRMRQMACHPDLVLKSKRNTALTGEIVEAAVCRLCNDIAEDAIESKCHHIFDRECIKQYLNTAVEANPACPVCHVPITIDLDAPAIEQDEEAPTKARQGILGRLDIDTWRSSSKIEALLEELTNLRNKDATTKSLVFSQFVNFLDLIAFRLQRAGFVICRLEGTMSPQARNATIQHFMNNVEVTVFLVSLKAGGVALNLTEASRVYLMDSWWNPAVEYQAMDRIHRLGQHRPVHAIKLVIEDSIESRIVQLQEKKSAMVDATLSSDDSAMGRLTPEDLGFLFRL